MLSIPVVKVSATAMLLMLMGLCLDQSFEVCDKGNRFKGNKKDENGGVKFPGGFSLSDMEKMIEEYKSGSSLRDLQEDWKKSTTTINKAIKKYEEYLAQTNSNKSNSETPIDDYIDYEEVE